MATITKLQRKTGTVYKARIRRPLRGELTRTFSTRSDALRWARKVEAEVDRDEAGITSEASKHTLSQAIKRYRKEVLPDLQPETRRKYEQHLDHWEPKLGHLRLSDCRAEKIAAARDELLATPISAKAEGGKPRKRSATTANRYMATLAAVFTATVKRWHWLQVSPMQQVATPAEKNGGTRFLSEDELKRLLDVCRQSESPDLLLAVLLSITTGARQGEILGLRWQDVDLDAGLLHLRVDNATKTKGDVRSVPIVTAALPILKARFDAYQEAQKKRTVRDLRDPGLVFPSRISRNSPVNLRTPWETALRRAGIENFRWHDLRHSAASFLAKNGASLIEIGAVLGHKSANTTKRYSHLTEQHTHALVRGMSDKLLGGE
jgi:integrase